VSTEPEIGPLIATGNVAEVFAYGDDVLKLYKPGIGPASAEREASILAWLAGTGLPVPRGKGLVQHEGRFGLVMTRLAGVPFAEPMLAAGPPDPAWFEALVGLHRRVNMVPGAGMTLLVERLAERIGGAPLDDGVRAGLLRRLKAMPVGDRLCHGDFHPFNVLGTPADATVIDWLDATCGEPAADLCRTYVLMRPWAPEFAEAYVEAYGLPRAAVMAWLPFVAAGRLAENIPAADRAMLEPMALAGG
jgi:hypothetical protein